MESRWFPCFKFSLENGNEHASLERVTEETYKLLPAHCTKSLKLVLPQLARFEICCTMTHLTPVCAVGRNLLAQLTPFFPNSVRVSLKQYRVIGPAPILVRNDFNRKRPHDAKNWIIKAHAPRKLWCIELRRLIVHFCVILECLITVGKAFRRIEHPAILFGQFHADPLLVRG